MPSSESRYPARTLAATLVAVALLPSGCGKPRRAPLPRTDITGTVTLDGRPLVEGEVAFLALNGQAVDTLPIRNGAFHGSVSIGPQRVEFAAFTIVKRSVLPDQPPENVRENSLPPQYHAQSTLTADIQAGGNPPLSFELQSQRNLD